MAVRDITVIDADLLRQEFLYDPLTGQFCRLHSRTGGRVGDGAKRGTGRFKGVFQRGKYFESSIREDGKLVYLGRFRRDVDAAIAYDVAAIRVHRQFARTNILPLMT